MKSNTKRLAVLTLLLCSALYGCADALQRGMLGDAYISTARPAIMAEAVNMPLMLAGRGSCNLEWTSMVGGLPISVWLAVYGTGGLSPMAIIAQAQTPEGWYWDGIMRRPFSVDEGVEVFNGVSYQACTFIINPANDPFGALVTGTQPDGQPQLWMVRAYAARFNFNDDKIIMEYREPLPDNVNSLSALPYGQAMLLAEFAQRARDTFKVSNVPGHPSGITTGYANAIQWQYMDQSFLGSVSKNISWNIE